MVNEISDFRVLRQNDSANGIGKDNLFAKNIYVNLFTQSDFHYK